MWSVCSAVFFAGMYGALPWRGYRRSSTSFNMISDMWLSYWWSPKRSSIWSTGMPNQSSRSFHLHWHQCKHKILMQQLLIETSYLPCARTLRYILCQPIVLTLIDVEVPLLPWSDSLGQRWTRMIQLTPFIGTTRTNVSIIAFDPCNVCWWLRDVGPYGLLMPPRLSHSL